MDSICDRGMGFFFRHYIRTEYEAHLTSHSVDIGGSFLGSKVTGAWRWPPRYSDY